MDSTQFSELIAEFRYILAKISKYLKNNQYVYLRAFNSWMEGYNQLATRLNADKTVSVPIVKLTPADYSPTGKSIKMASVDKFVKTINHQIIRLEDKLEELNQRSAQPPHPLIEFFHCDKDGTPVEPPPAAKRVFVAIPAGEMEAKLFWQGIQPALEMQGLSFFRTDRTLLDDAALCEICQELLSCRLAVLNLSGQASNVMLALGLAYGIGKPVIILQQQNEPALGELSNNGYLRYTSADDLKTSLTTLLPELLKS